MLKRLFLACVLGFALALPAAATSILPLFLDEIVDQAASAFEGTVTQNRSERDAQTGMIVTYTTFQVHDVMKGRVGATHTVKQIGGELPAEGVGFKVESVPTFTVGQSYVVFFAGVSPLGFSSPIGLAQGRFTVLPQGSVTNGRDFKELTARMAPQGLPKAAQAKLGAAGAVRELGLEEFKSLVRARAGTVK